MRQKTTKEQNPDILADRQQHKCLKAPEVPRCDSREWNQEIKRQMAVELIELGLNREIVCQILNINQRP